MGIIWGFVSLLFFLFFSVPPPGQEHPQWYLNGITVLETGAFVLSSLLCLRNWKSGQIVSGGNVWLWIGLGLLSFSFGNLLFYLWGNVWGKDPAVSLGDAFYLMSYIFLAMGMFQAVLPRRLNLDIRQWVVILIVGLLGVGLAFFLTYRGETEVEAEGLLNEATIQEVAPASPTEAPVAPDVGAISEEPETSTAPAWVVSLDAFLEPFEFFVSLLYVLGDCLLLVVATTLLVAFWGGRFSQSWKLIAIAAICLYVADMCFAYYVSQSDYQEGALWEVFWTFSAVFFALGAIIEYAISTRSRRNPRRRRVSSS